MKKSIDYRIECRNPKFQNFYNALLRGPFVYGAWAVANRAAQEISMEATGRFRSAIEG